MADDKAVAAKVQGLERRLGVLESYRRTHGDHPMGKWAYVDVAFPTADTDIDILHELLPANPEQVRWVVVALEGDAYLYRDDSANRRAWARRYISLRASDVCTARILLFLETPD